MTVLYGLILSGGRGNRLNGQDKGLIQVAGKFLVQHVINALSPQVDQVMISANRNLDQYKELGFKVLADDIDGYAGPLAGLYRGLKELTTSVYSADLVVVAPTDAPLLPADLVSRLLKEYQKDGMLAVIPHDGTILQPLFGLYSIRILQSLEAYLAEGNRKVMLWIDSIPHHVVDFSDNPGAFLNINTESDLESARNALG